MASLIGIDWPVNSVGVLSDVESTQPGFLEVDDESIASAALR
jgi:phosphatidylinositol glycan class N